VAAGVNVAVASSLPTSRFVMAVPQPQQWLRAAACLHGDGAGGTSAVRPAGGRRGPDGDAATELLSSQKAGEGRGVSRSAAVMGCSRGQPAWQDMGAEAGGCLSSRGGSNALVGLYSSEQSAKISGRSPVRQCVKGCVIGEIALTLLNPVNTCLF